VTSGEIRASAYTSLCFLHAKQISRRGTYLLCGSEEIILERHESRQLSGGVGLYLQYVKHLLLRILVRVEPDRHACRKEEEGMKVG